MARYEMDYRNRGSNYGGYGYRGGSYGGRGDTGGSDYGYGNMGGGGNQGGGYGGRPEYQGRGGMRYDAGYQGGGYGMDPARGNYSSGDYGGSQGRGYGGSQGGGYGGGRGGYGSGGYSGGQGGQGGYGRGGNQEMNVRASDIMTDSPETVAADATLSQAAKKMRDLNVGIIPVVESEKNRRLKGVITDRDITIRAVAEGKDVNSAKVSEFMSSDVETCNKNDSVRDVMGIMRREQIRRVPVTDREGRLVGIIAQADLATDYAGDRPERERLVEDTVERISEPGRPERGGTNSDRTDRTQNAQSNVRSGAQSGAVAANPGTQANQGGAAAQSGTQDNRKTQEKKS